ncbi:hypothetical protein ACFWH7_19565 [Cellulosimicrobium cellulans]|uniref:hypothetical protein n=1 Tax=Cellulosimicrobium cellulans TaxID=1710 RepID=UPI003650CA86
MTRSTQLVLGGIVALLIASVTLLIALGRDADALVGYLSSTIVPAVVALWAGNTASKARQAAERAEHNTNGRMTELIEKLPPGTVDQEKYADVMPDEANPRHLA